MIGCFIDVGSTFTKVRVIDMETGELLVRTNAPTTVKEDVMIGLENALAHVERDSDIDREDIEHWFASSSAAGGLRMVVIGFSPEYTLKAGNRTALGAGANVIESFTWYLSSDEIREIDEQLVPDVILLTGGADGGNTRALRKNAQKLTELESRPPIILAGNRDVRDECAATLREAGFDVTVADNIIGETADKLHVDDAREKTRKTFMDQIIHAKGIGKIRDLITEDTIMPTPEAVSYGLQLFAEGTGELGGLGDSIAVDVGGATTDVHSVGEGDPTNAYVAVSDDLEEPYRKRTVEGDLGIRWNAPTILDRFGTESVLNHLEGRSISDRDIEAYVSKINEETEYVPGDDDEMHIDHALASVATDVATTRHAGKLQRNEGADQDTFAAAGEAGEIEATAQQVETGGKQNRLPTKHVQVGKDLTEFSTVVGTGGVLSNNPYAHATLRNAEKNSEDLNELLPEEPEYYIDSNYILFACGLMAESFPNVAMRTLRKNILRPPEVEHVNTI